MNPSSFTYAPAHRRDSVQIPTFWIAFALSLVLHVAIMWQWLPRLHLPSSEVAERGDGRLTVQLAPPPAPPLTLPRAPAPPAAAASPPPRPAARPPQATPRPRPAPPVIALNRQAPKGATPPPSAPAAQPAPAPPAAPGDMASYIEARRRARGDAPASAATPDNVASAGEDANTRANRLAVANLASTRSPTFGSDPRSGGGIFGLQRVGLDRAEFLFFGWNKDMRRNTTQLIEVRKGNNPDIQVAIVRRMIEIIRDNETGDFRWESKRLGRDVILSARLRDNAGLEEFLMREFFAEESRR